MDMKYIHRLNSAVLGQTALTNDVFSEKEFSSQGLHEKRSSEECCGYKRSFVLAE